SGRAFALSQATTSASACARAAPDIATATSAVPFNNKCRRLIMRTSPHRTRLAHSNSQALADRQRLRRHIPWARRAPAFRATLIGIADRHGALRGLELQIEVAEPADRSTRHDQADLNSLGIARHIGCNRMSHPARRACRCTRLHHLYGVAAFR